MHVLGPNETTIELLHAKAPGLVAQIETRAAPEFKYVPLTMPILA